jgi:hypothetical protein
MKRLSVFLCAMVLVLGFVGTSNAFLYDRGNGLIYDSDQNITWLQDANLAATEKFGVSEYNPDTSYGIDYSGRMGWNTAQDWIAAMNAANYKGYEDWRLPATVEGPSWWGTIFYNGTTTCGWNNTSSELGYMFYNNLGNLGAYTYDGTLRDEGVRWTNSGPFAIPQDYASWSGTELASIPAGCAIYFYFRNGVQWFGPNDGGNTVQAWAVRDGDVASVPIPGVVWLLGSGLACVGVCRRKAGRRLQ